VQSRSVLGPMTGHALRLAFSTAMAVLLVGCASFSPPPTSAGPDVVLRAYLDALVHGDCSAGKVLGTANFVQRGGGELCGATQVKSYAIGGGAPSPFSDEVVYATTLETTGSGDGSVPPGTITWFYDLKRQADGSWRLVGGGSGP
jgi:hypothetical protein